MKNRFKLLVGIIAAAVTVGVMSVSALAATDFSFGEATGSGEISIPIKLDTTEYTHIGGCHFIVEYPDGYTFKEYTQNAALPTENTGASFYNDEAAKRVDIVWYTGKNQAVEEQHLLLGNIKFTAGAGAKPAQELALRPQELIYIDGVENGQGGTMKIAELTGLATFITYDIKKEQSDWTHGKIKSLYISADEDKKAGLEYLIDNGDSYTVVIKLALDENETKKVMNIKLHAVTTDGEDFVLNDFGSVVVENMNKINAEQ